MSNDFVSKPRVLGVYNSIINQEVLAKQSEFEGRVPNDDTFKDLKKEFKALRKDYRALVEKGDKIKSAEHKKKQALEKKLNNKKYDNVKELLEIKSDKKKMGGNIKYRLAAITHVVLSDIIDFAADATIEGKKKQVTVNFLYGDNGEHLFSNCESYGLISGLDIINNPEPYFRVHNKRSKKSDDESDNSGSDSDSESDNSEEVVELCDRRFVTSIGKLCGLKKSEEAFASLSFGKAFKTFLSGVVYELLERFARMSIACHKLLTTKTIQSEMLDAVLESIEVYSGCEKSISHRVSELNETVYVKPAKSK